MPGDSADFLTDSLSQFRKIEKLANPLSQLCDPASLPRDALDPKAPALPV